MTAALLLAAALSASAAPAREPFPRAVSDRRVELLGMVRLLARDEVGAAGFYRRDRPYERELEKRLAPLALHPVVARWKELERAGLTYVAAYQWVLTLGQPPELAASAAGLGDAAQAAGGPEGVEEFRLMLADFARAADFETLYARTAPLREPMVEDVRRQAEKLRLGKTLEDYWGGDFGVRYTLIVSEFVEPAIAVSAVTRDPDGGTRLTSLTGAEEFEGKVRPRLTARAGAVWAETLNAALTPAFAAQAARLEASSSLFSETSGRCAPTWTECARKEAAFAAATRLLRLTGDDAAADEYPIKYGRVGMPHLSPLVAELKKFEKSRSRRLTLDRFVPRLIAVYDGLAARGASAPPFSLGISAALSDPAPCVLIVPSKPAPALAAALSRFRRDRRLCGEELTGEQALARRLSGRGVVAVGALSENAWLRRRWPDLTLPARLEGGTLRMNARPGERAATEYAGDIGFVSVARNPDDVSRPVLLFTAEDPARVPALLTGFEETADYEIRDGGATIKSGMYEKSRIPWRTK